MSRTSQAQSLPEISFACFNLPCLGREAIEGRSLVSGWPGWRRQRIIEVGEEGDLGEGPH